MIDNRLHFLVRCHDCNLITEDQFKLANDWYINQNGHEMDFQTALSKFYDWKVANQTTR